MDFRLTKLERRGFFPWAVKRPTESVYNRGTQTNRERRPNERTDPLPLAPLAQPAE